jgi:hypothetical protein
VELAGASTEAITCPFRAVATCVLVHTVHWNFGKIQNLVKVVSRIKKSF